MKLKKGKSLGFFSAKGGVGKTVNLINLAGIFQQLGKKVLMIDLDLYSGGIANALNKPFDPTKMDAILTEKVEGTESNVVIDVLQKGYIYNDKVIRPAMVKVSE